VCRVACFLVEWHCQDTKADDEWLLAEELLHQPQKVAEFDATTPRRSTPCEPSQPELCRLQPPRRFLLRWPL
jgi:hypothetical protein